jgi:hypothetical protein
MKFAAALLLGAVSAFDEVELPRYAIDHSAYCNNLMASSGSELSYAMRSLPASYDAQVASLRTADFLNGFAQLCSYSGNDMFCSYAAEQQLSSRYSAAHAALDKCGYNCYRLKNSLKSYFSNLKRCMHQVGLDYTQMIKVTVPTAQGQTRLENDIKEIEVDVRKISQSQAAHAIMEDIARWEASPEAKQLERDLDAFSKSPSGKSLQVEIQEALNVLQRSVHELKNGVELRNGAIP